MALENVYRITVNTKKKMFREIPEVIANDNVVFEVQVYDDTVLFPLSGSYTYRLVSQKISGKSVMRDGVLSGDVIKFTIGSDEGLEPGKVEGMIQISDTNMKRISTAKFDYVVKKDPSLQGGLPADDKTLVIANESLMLDAIDKSKQAMSRVDELILKTPQPSEVVDARGGEVNLKARLDKFNSSLAEKVNKDEINTTNTNVTANAIALASKVDKTYVDTKIGNIGNSKTFKGSITFASLPSSGNSNGDYYYVTDKTTNYCWNGTSWVDIGNNVNLGDGTVTLPKTNLPFLKKLANLKSYFTADIGGQLTASGTVSSLNLNKTGAYRASLDVGYYFVAMNMSITYASITALTKVRPMLRGSVAANKFYIDSSSDVVKYPNTQYLINGSDRFNIYSVLNVTAADTYAIGAFMEGYGGNSAVVTFTINDISLIKLDDISDLTKAKVSNGDLVSSYGYLDIYPQLALTDSQKSNIYASLETRVYTVEQTLSAGNTGVQDGSITTVKLQDGAVTNTKLSTDLKNKLLSKWSGKKVVTYGDSTVQQGKWQQYLIDKLGVNIVNVGISGAPIELMNVSDPNYNPAVDDDKNSKGLCLDTKLATIPSDADLVIFMAGYNDVGFRYKSVPFSTGTVMEADLNLDKYNMQGALGYIIKNIFTIAPNAKLLIVGQPYAYDTRVKYVNYTNVRSAIKDTADFYGIPYVDTYDSWNFWNYMKYHDVANDVHFNTKGGNEVANRIIRKMIELEPIS